MAISSIKRDWGVEPTIVRITCNDTLAAITTTGYLTGTAVAASVQLVNSGQFDWNGATQCLITYAGGQGSFIYNSATNSFIPNASVASRTAIVPITAAQFNGMYAAPIALVPAGGANTLLVLQKLELLLTYNSAAYAAGGVAAVQYDSTINGAGVIASTTQAAANFQVTASTGIIFNPGVVAQTFSTCVNKGLYLSNITGAFTTGNSTMVAYVDYKTIATA